MNISNEEETMIAIKERQDDSVTLEVSGTVTRADYEYIVPQLEKMVSDHGKVRALVQLNQFKGWTPGALVDELRFDIRHRKDFSRCAVLGERSVEKIGTKLAAPFFEGEVRFFPKEEIQHAKEWLAAA